MVPNRSVLIVDRSEETREVLRTALERRGLKIFDADEAEAGLQLARRHHPDLIVLDLEVEAASAEEVYSPFEKEAESGQASLVVLGSLRRERRDAAAGEFVAKPYHYAPLIRRIEELLAATGRPHARSA